MVVFLLLIRTTDLHSTLLEDEYVFNSEPCLFSYRRPYTCQMKYLMLLWMWKGNLLPWNAGTYIYSNKHSGMTVHVCQYQSMSLSVGQLICYRISCQILLQMIQVYENCTDKWIRDHIFTHKHTHTHTHTHTGHAKIISRKSNLKFNVPCMMIGSGSHPASYPKDTGGFFLGGKAVGTWSWPLTSI
jgi:hypothetical protein